MTSIDIRSEVQAIGLAVCAWIALEAIWRGIVRRAHRRHATVAIAIGLVTLLLVAASIVTAVRITRRAEQAAGLPAPGAFERASLDVWIDTDPSCGLRPNADVDDCWALLTALRTPSLKIAGISSVFGNADGESTYRKAREVVTIANANIAMWQGANTAGTWRSTQASEAQAKALEQRPLTILALRTLTNIATVLERRPELRSRIIGVIFVGGRRPGQLFHPGRQWWFHFRDLNVCGDAAARFATVSRPRLAARRCRTHTAARSCPRGDVES